MKIDSQDFHIVTKKSILSTKSTHCNDFWRIIKTGIMAAENSALPTQE